MKHSLTVHMILRASALVCMASFIAYDLFLSTFSVEDLTLDVYLSCVLLAMYPYGPEKMVSSVVEYASFIAAALVLKLFGLMSQWIIFLSLVFLLEHNIRGSIQRFSNLRQYVGSMALWHAIEDYVHLFYSMLALSLGCLMYLQGLWWWKFALALSFFLVLMYKAISGYTFFFSKEKELRLKEMSRNRNCNTMLPKPDSRMATLYSHIMEIMENKKPYLDEGFVMRDLAKMLFTNQTYVSRTINNCSGGSFPKMLNKYRIDYALEKMAENPDIKLGELWPMCGFHNEVSFNAAFRLRTGVTPSEYQRNMKVKGKL